MRVAVGHAPGPCLRTPRIYWSREVAGVMVGSGREGLTNLLHVTLYPPGRSSFSHHRGRWVRGPRGYGPPPSLPGYSWASPPSLPGYSWVTPSASDRGGTHLTPSPGARVGGGAGCGAAPGPGMAAAAVAAAPGRAGGPRGAP